MSHGATTDSGLACDAQAPLAPPGAANRKSRIGIPADVMQEAQREANKLGRTVYVCLVGHPMYAGPSEMWIVTHPPTAAVIPRRDRYEVAPNGRGERPGQKDAAELHEAMNDD